MSKQQKSSKAIGWSGAGFVIGFAIGYLVIGNWISAILLAIGLALAMGLVGTKPGNK